MKYRHSLVESCKLVPIAFPKVSQRRVGQMMSILELTPTAAFLIGDKI